MSVIGLGAPDSVRVCFAGLEVDVLVDVLREQRAEASHAVAEAYVTAPRLTQAVDDRHDRLRSVEALLMQLEDLRHTRRGAVLLGKTELMCDVVRAGARGALRRLAETQVRYEDPASLGRATRCWTRRRRQRRGS